MIRMSWESATPPMASSKLIILAPDNRGVQLDDGDHRELVIHGSEPAMRMKFTRMLTYHVETPLWSDIRKIGTMWRILA